VAEKRRASAIASMMLGLTLANLLGVPVATAIGGLAGWRLAFVLITGIGLLCVAGILATVPRGEVTEHPSLVAEFSALRKPVVLLVLGTVVLGASGLFAFYTFITPMMTDLAGFSPTAIPILLAVFGLGMTVGAVAGGKLADRFDPRRVVVGLLAVQAALLVAAVFAVRSPILAPVVVFGVGALGLMFLPSVQSAVMDAAGNAPALASATIQSAFNIANALGASLGGLTLAAGLGLAAPPGAGALLSTLALVPAVLTVALARRMRLRAVAVPA
jgi:MFS transporter, DHA1 family, inner membrane transport protein